uniref:Uncharacterized protein n=1 Tax=Xenopus tropicalis TaxID=8364 RepID=A0A6I8Q903_XENTR
MPSLLGKFLVLFFIILAVSFDCSGAPSEPMHPGDQASPEQLAKYYDDWWQYITFITRPSSKVEFTEFIESLLNILLKIGLNPNLSLHINI